MPQIYGSGVQGIYWPCRLAHTLCIELVRVIVQLVWSRARQIQIGSSWRSLYRSEEGSVAYFSSNVALLYFAQVSKPLRVSFVFVGCVRTNLAT
jgi:hypothetical protein